MRCWAMCAMVTVAVAALWTGLLTSDFSLEYVASYSSITLPIQYKFAALWGGQQGSLLFWTWLLSIFTSIAIFQNRRRNPEITPWALIVLAGVAIFFLGMLNFVTRPFDLLATVPPDGSDLNPLLQNYWMAIHPPSLYTGYVSASGAVRLRLRRADHAQARRRMDSHDAPLGDLLVVLSHARQSVRRALGLRGPGMGRLLGVGPGRERRLHAVAGDDGLPALGDDPGAQGHAEGMEPGAHRDGLHAHAIRHFPHSQRRDLLGPFVHPIGAGPYFLTFLIVVVLGYTALLLSRVNDLKSPAEFESYLSREAAFLFNNLMLVGIAFAVFWGTRLPGYLGSGARGQNNRRAAVL